LSVRVKQYATGLERETGKGKSLDNAHKVSAMRSQAGSKGDKFDRPSTMDKVILALLKAKKKVTKK